MVRRFPATGFSDGAESADSAPRAAPYVHELRWPERCNDLSIAPRAVRRASYRGDQPPPSDRGRFSFPRPIAVLRRPDSVFSPSSRKPAGVTTFRVTTFFDRFFRHLISVLLFSLAGPGECKGSGYRSRSDDSSLPPRSRDAHVSLSLSGCRWRIARCI